MKPFATRSVRLAVFGLLALAAAWLGLLWWGDISVALADSASGRGNGIRLSVKNGWVLFNSCNGKCKVSDVDPISAGPGPLRPWQKDFLLTRRGLKTTFETPKGEFISWLGKPATICLRFTAAEASAAGGKNFLRVAYWDKRLKDCDANGCTTGRWYVLYTTYTPNNEACALLRRTSTFALVILSKNASAAATQFSNVSTPLAPTSVPSNNNNNSSSNPPADTQPPDAPAPTNTPKPPKVPPTDTLVPTSTFTPMPSATYTWIPSRTATPVPPTATPVPPTRPPTNTRIRLPTSTHTFTPAPPTATNTLVAPTATNTLAPTATNTFVPTNTDTPVPTNTDTLVPTNTNTPVPTDTPRAPIPP